MPDLTRHCQIAVVIEVGDGNSLEHGTDIALNILEIGGDTCGTRQSGRSVQRRFRSFRLCPCLKGHWFHRTFSAPALLGFCCSQLSECQKPLNTRLAMHCPGHTLPLPAFVQVHRLAGYADGLGFPSSGGLFPSHVLQKAHTYS